MECNVQSPLKLKTPAGIILTGPSQAGKTYFLKELLNNLPCMFDTTFKTILYCYGERNAIPKDVNTHDVPFKLHEGLPTEWDETTLGIKSPALIVIDDLIQSALKQDNVETLFTNKIHHMQWTVILVTQNLFYQSKIARTVSLNANYFIFFNNFRDKAQFAHFARQIEPLHFKELVRIYNEALSKQYAHFLIDLTVSTPPALRYRSCVLPSDDACLFWTTRENLESLKNDTQTFNFS
jgi:hypothetical protein